MEECSLYRRGSSIAREDRTMDIDTHFFRDFENVHREYLPIGYYHEIVTCKTSHYIEYFNISSYLFGSIGGDIIFCRDYFDSTWPHRLISSKGLIWICHDKSYLYIRCPHEVLKYLAREIRSTEKSYSHVPVLGVVFFSIACSVISMRQNSSL